MNYTQMFANGGKTSDQDLIKGIQKILGVDDAQMEQLLQVGINKYGSLEGIGQALSQATQGLTQNSSPEEVQAAVASVFQTNAESQMFKCGGKLQQLVSKFGKGGPVDCGCGGIKVGQEGFKTSGKGTDPDAGFHTWDIEITPQKDTIVNYSYPSYNGKAILTPNGGTVKEWLNGDSLPTVYRDRNWFARHPRRALLPFIGNLNNAKIINARELAQNHIPSQQEGGVMLEQMPGYDVNTNLTRRQARQLAAQNQGYSGEQFNFAMANAMNALRNQGLRGKELRERAREMAAGISPAQRSIVEAPTVQQLPEGFGNVAKITAPAQLVLPETQALLDAMLDQTNATLTKRLQTSSKRTNDQKPVFTGSTSSQKKAPTSEQQARVARGQAREQASNASRAKSQNYILDNIAYAYDINGNPIMGPINSSLSSTMKDLNMVPAGGGSFNWMQYKCGGKVKSKEGIKLAKCGKKVKK